MKKSDTKLTELQKKSWNQDGFLFLPAIMPASDVLKFRSAVDNLYSQKADKIPNKKFFIGFDQKFIVDEDDIFLELIDYAPTFEYILDIMGPCIQLCISHALIRPAKNEFNGFMHVDGGQSMQKIILHNDSPPIQVKIQYFLTDIQEEQSGNLTVFPGSHRKFFPIMSEDRTNVLENLEKKQITAKAGDAIIFFSSLWHGVVKNTSLIDRKSLIYGYNQLFLRPYDYHIAPANLLNKCTPRQRRLLGDMGVRAPQAFYYAPNDQVMVIEGLRERPTL